MKAFEEWWGSLAHVAPEDKSVMEWSWKTALEWLYDELDYSEEHKKIKDIVEGELEKW